MGGDSIASVTRLTTPTQFFEFEYDPSEYARIQITYKQGSNIILVKEKEDLIIEPEVVDEKTVYVASFKLTQEETKKFAPGNSPVKIQVRIITASGDADASDIYSLSVKDVLNDEVLI